MIRQGIRPPVQQRKEVHSVCSCALALQPGEIVAQIKGTVLLMSNGSSIVTKAPEVKVESEKKVRGQAWGWEGAHKYARPYTREGREQGWRAACTESLLGVACAIGVSSCTACVTGWSWYSGCLHGLLERYLHVGSGCWRGSQDGCWHGRGCVRLNACVACMVAG